jgi:hypothetical protein
MLKNKHKLWPFKKLSVFCNSCLKTSRPHLVFQQLHATPTRPVHPIKLDLTNVRQRAMARGNCRVATADRRTDCRENKIKYCVGTQLTHGSTTKLPAGCLLSPFNNPYWRMSSFVSHRVQKQWILPCRVYIKIDNMYWKFYRKPTDVNAIPQGWKKNCIMSNQTCRVFRGIKSGEWCWDILVWLCDSALSIPECTQQIITLSVKQSLYSPGEALRAAGVWGCKNVLTVGT